MLAGALALTGCAAEPPTPPATADPQPTDPQPTDTPGSSETTVPQLVPDGTAEDNLPVFTSAVTEVWNSPDNVSGRAYVDALVAAGFDKAAMELTADTTPVGNAAESIQFSVLWGDECLIGQVGPAIGTPVSIVAPALLEGGCLVGETRPIDW